MRTETYSEADARAEKLLDSILVRKHTGGQVAKAVTAGNVWRSLSNGTGWDPQPRNPIAATGESPEGLLTRKSQRINADAYELDRLRGYLTLPPDTPAREVSDEIIRRLKT
jgi:hypothetical protein